MQRFLCIAVTAAALSLAGCGGSEDEPSGPYEGAWTLTLTGDSDGTAQMQVRQLPSNFTTNVTLAGNTKGTFLFQMTVDSTGNLTGNVYCLLLVLCGNINGSLAENAGSGTYTVSLGSGVWTATRN